MAAPVTQSIRQLMKEYGVVQGSYEGLAWSFFDSASYIAAGQTVLPFFQNGLGQGAGFGGGPKTLSDTNMYGNGQFPAGQKFLCQQIEIDLQPSTPSVAAQNPSSAVGVQATDTFVNDAWIVGRSGNLQMTVLQKRYVENGPICKFPSSTPFQVMGFESALTGTTQAGLAATADVRTGSGFFAGPVYDLGDWAFFIDSLVNFNISLNWPEGVQAIANPLRIFVRMNGVFFRQGQ